MVFFWTAPNTFAISERCKIPGKRCGTTATSLHLFCQRKTSCIEKKDVGKKSALLCGFFAPYWNTLSEKRKKIKWFTKRGSVISKLRKKDAN